MKRLLIALLLLTVSPAVIWADGDAEPIVKVNGKTKTSIIAKQVKKYGEKDPKIEAAYEKALNDAFDEYFTNKSVQVDVTRLPEYVQLSAEADAKDKTLDAKEKELLAKDKEIEKLKANSSEAHLQELKSSHAAALGDLQAQKDAEIAELKKQLADAQTKLSQAQAEISEYEANQGFVKNITTQLDKERNAFEDAYASTTSGSLLDIRDIPGIQANVVSYEKFLELLQQKLTADEQNRKKQIEAICNAAGTYREATELLNKKFDKTEVSKAVSGLKKVQLALLAPQQKDEITKGSDLLENEQYAIQNFNTILDEISKEGLIPTDKVANEMSKIIENNLALFNDDENKNSYDKGYLYLNKQLDKLKDGVKNYSKKGLDESAKFNQFIAEIRTAVN